MNAISWTECDEGSDAGRVDPAQEITDGAAITAAGCSRCAAWPARRSRTPRPAAGGARGRAPPRRSACRARRRPAAPARRRAASSANSGGCAAGPRPRRLAASSRGVVREPRATLRPRRNAGPSRCCVANSGCASHSSTNASMPMRLDARGQRLVGRAGGQRARPDRRCPARPPMQHQRRDAVRMAHRAAEREPRAHRIAEPVGSLVAGGVERRDEVVQRCRRTHSAHRARRPSSRRVPAGPAPACRTRARTRGQRPRCCGRCR